MPLCAGLNDRAPDLSGFDRMAKPYELLRILPRTVLLGSSTARAGFNSFADWDTSLPQPAYNYALLGASAHELRLSLAQALRECPVETVVIVADFFAFNAHYLDNERFEPARLTAATRQSWLGFRSADLFAFTIGRETLGLSWETLRESHQAGGSGSPAPSWQGYPWRVHFRNCERSYLVKWFPPPASKYEFASAQTGGDRLADFDAMLQMCAGRGVRLIVLCPPIHARLHESLNAAGAWTHYESWKRELASRTRVQQTQRSALGRVELWDFSVFNELTCEPLPADASGPMLYFFDSAHFTPVFGRLLLHEVLDGASSHPARLGVRLDQVDIETHLTSVRAALHAFGKENPAVVADVHLALGIAESSGTAPMAISPADR